MAASRHDATHINEEPAHHFPGRNFHSRGVLSAVRCFTDATVREHNEKYLADQFPEGEFAILLRVRVVGNETMSPDLRDATARLYEWEPKRGRKVTEAGIAASRSVAAVGPALTPVAG